MSAADANTIAYIGLGANLGDRVQALRAAARAMQALPQTRLLQLSSLYESKAAEGAEGSGDFLNAVAALETGLCAHDLLAALQDIEQQAGRERPYHHAPRTLDLDILLFGPSVIGDAPRLIVPHPRMAQRDFVLLPLREIAQPWALALVGNQQSTPLVSNSCQIKGKNWCDIPNL